MQAEIPSHASFIGAVCIRDVMVLEVNWKSIAGLIVRHVLLSK